MNKRKTISSASSEESSISPEAKKTKQQLSPRQFQDDEIMTALSMTQDLGATLQAILDKLDKLDTIESAVKKIETKLESLERRILKLEDFQQRRTTLRI